MTESVCQLPGIDEMRKGLEQADLVRSGAARALRGRTDHPEGLQVLQGPEKGRRPAGQRGQGRNRHSELLQEIQKGMPEELYMISLGGPLSSCLEVAKTLQY